MSHRASPLFAVVAAFLGGCAARAPFPAPTPRDYRVGLAAAVGGHTVTSIYTLQTRPAGPRTWTVATTASEDSWEDASGAVTFDSMAPSAGAPLPLVGQHAVASVPAAIRFDKKAVPDALLDPVGWAVLARAALGDTGLPESAVASLDALVDADGLVRDLARSFPGAPAAAWVRVVRVAGVDMDRVELCDRTVDGGTTTWACTGELTLPEGTGVLVHEADSWSRLVVDRHGLQAYEEGWAGTLVHAIDDRVVDEPFAGRRLVERQD